MGLRKNHSHDVNGSKEKDGIHPPTSHRKEERSLFLTVCYYFIVWRMIFKWAFSSSQLLRGYFKCTKKEQGILFTEESLASVSLFKKRELSARVDELFKSQRRLPTNNEKIVLLKTRLDNYLRTGTTWWAGPNTMLCKVWSWIPFFPISLVPSMLQMCICLVAMIDEEVNKGLEPHGDATRYPKGILGCVNFNLTGSKAQNLRNLVTTRTIWKQF